MSGGTLMVWLRVCSASIGVPAAMRPITGTATGRSPLSSATGALPERLPSVPSMTLGVKPRRLTPPPPASSGSLITSMARARLGRRRMKPRSSSAVISRWMPDFERKSRASFISSKEGGTPASLSLSLMKRRSSYCLRVSIASNPQLVAHRSMQRFLNSESRVRDSCGERSSTPPLETNHERTLYVRYVFRNYLILGEGDELLSGTPNQCVNPAGAKRPQRCPLPPPAQTAHVSLIPVPQREIQAARSPDASRAWRSIRRHFASRA